MHQKRTGLSIVVYGCDVSSHLVVAALRSGLEKSVKITHITPPESHTQDCLYGGLVGPKYYEFFRSIGLDEPRLILQSNTSFSYGSMFRNWPGAVTEWAQCFHLPLPVIADLPIHNHLTEYGMPIQDCLVSAKAGIAGKFAHPPSDQSNPLSRAEYGYHVSPAELIRLIESLPSSTDLARVQGNVEKIAVSNGLIESVTLQSGECVSGDLFLDCSGLGRTLMTKMGAEFVADRSLFAQVSRTAYSGSVSSVRAVEAFPHGWSIEVPLQDRCETLSVTDAEGIEHVSAPHETNAIDNFPFKTGALKEAWIGNCIALGSAACVLEPITHAPTELLRRSIERLLELIPNSHEMFVERREFNRLHTEDLNNARDFTQAYFVCDHLPHSGYWAGAAQLPLSPSLSRRLEMYENRGALVQYDLEPFTPEDWTILHAGVGRAPRRSDVRFQSGKREGWTRIVRDMQHSVAAIVDKMPPQEIYLARFKEYLKKAANERAQ